MYASVKPYVGNVTYEGEGFNCFGDDGHPVHVDSRLGQCYTTIFCLHHDATVINFSASTEVISWQTHEQSPIEPPKFTNAQGAVNDIMAQVKKAKTGPMTCDDSSIDIGNSCSMKVSCESSDVTSDALTGLVDIMVNAYSNNDTLFQTINADECHGKDMLICNHYRGVSIPARYHLATVNVAPSGGDGSLPPVSSSSLQATLDVEISCDVTHSDPLLCAALRAMFTVGGASLGGVSGGMFAGFGGMTIASCK